MRIAILAPLTESVPPKTYGGTELVVSLLTEGLVAAGHQVTLFATGDSETNAELVSVVPHGLRLDNSIPTRRWAAYSIKQMIEFEKRYKEFDIVHNHMGVDAFHILRNSGIPNVTTNHNPVKDYCAPIYFHYSQLPYVSISNKYQQLNHPDKLNYVATIYNGIDFSKHNHALDNSRNHLLFLGRLCHDKGTAEAVEIAQKLGLPLKIAGKVDEADREYFEKFVKPHLSSNIVYLGEVDYQEKLDLYKHAIAVVYPINFDEPFGLVITESLASGTPIMAFGRGSVPELINDGEHGIIGKTVDDLVKRFPEIPNISAEKCRQHALSNFSKERMVNEYEKLFMKLCRQ